MNGSLLVPVAVTAKVVANPMQVPALGGAPFSQGASLEAGVHLHWALPDALTRARIQKRDQQTYTLFPGVPDLWLVVRLDPAGSVQGPKRTRGWRAWVVDSRAETSTALDTWQLPEAPNPSQILTAAGLLQTATLPDALGWGMLPANASSFDPAAAAYYPNARRRFGFYDNLAGLVGLQTVSYMVVGWYADPSHDPLYAAEDRHELQRRLKFSHFSGVKLIPIHIPSDANGSVVLRPWKVPITVVKQAASTAAQERVVLRARRRAVTRPLRKDIFGVTGGGPSDHVPPKSDESKTGATAMFEPITPTEIVCHGSVLGVQVRSTASTSPTLDEQQVRVFPSMSRALAGLATMRSDFAAADPQQVDFAEMLLQDLDQQKNSEAEVLDLPGAAHARTFQGVPGKNSRYARIDIFPGKAAAPSAQAQSRRNRLADHPPPDWAKLTPELHYTPKLPLSALSADQYNQALAASLATWRAEVRRQAAKVRDAQQTHPQLLRIQDYRSNAKTPALGQMIGDSGSDGAGWWLDLGDATNTDAVLDQLYLLAVGADIHMPDPANIFEQPGPRWYRPWSPQVVLLNAGRSFLFGADGFHQPDGSLRCRYTNETIYQIQVTGYNRLGGKQAINGAALTANGGLPREARALLEETALVDPLSSAVMAMQALDPAASPSTRQSAADAMRSVLRNIWGSSGDTAGDKPPLHWGQLPSPVAFGNWKDSAFDALFVDVSYVHNYSSVEHDWKLDEHRVECDPASTAATQPPPAQQFAFTERSYATATLADVLHSVLVSRKSLDPQGHLVAAPVASELNSELFKSLDIISAPLTRFDDQLIKKGRGERSGALRLQKITVVDIFGAQRSWTATQNQGNGQGSSYWTPLAPRLPGWSRLQFRLQAADAAKDAAQDAPAICGFLLPDFLEHALEIYDGAGMPLGQLVSEVPPTGDTPPTRLKISFVPHPWLPPGAGGTSAIKNGTLKSLVDGILAQSATAPAGENVENGLTALLRVFDTVRGTLDPTRKSADRKVRLIGEPIVVLTANLSLETAAVAQPAALNGDPPRLTGVTSPRIWVRIGDATRPNDGVLGCFLKGNSPAESRFAPVSSEAAEKAIRNGLIGNGSMAAVTHPFIKNQVSLFQIAPGEQRSVTILTDIRGQIYVTCGVLPRKQIAIPYESLEAALHRLAPTFQIGPVLALPRGGAVNPTLEAPQIEGMQATFLAGGDAHAEEPIAPRLPIAALPIGRALLTEGWIRMSYVEKKQSG